MQINKLEANIELTHTANWNSALPFSGGGAEEQKWSPLWGNLLGSVLMLRLIHGEERLEDVDVRLQRHNMALNGTASNDGNP